MKKQKKNTKNTTIRPEKREKSKKGRRIFLTSLFLLLLGIVGIFFWSITLQKSNIQVNNGSYELVGETSFINGQVTQKNVSCGGEKLVDDGTVKRAGGICDGGNSIVINNTLRVDTGGGGLSSKRPKYVSDIESIGAGDVIELRYAKDERGNASTNCSSCYIKKLKDYGIEAVFDEDNSRRSPSGHFIEE